MRVIDLAKTRMSILIVGRAGPFRQDLSAWLEPRFEVKTTENAPDRLDETGFRPRILFLISEPDHVLTRSYFALASEALARGCRVLHLGTDAHRSDPAWDARVVQLPPHAAPTAILGALQPPGPGDTQPQMPQALGL
ncbi:MAG: hypothetical protein ABIK96_02225 [bacterium]|nr:hypothetical protein [bacterium]